ncbi:MULTISPECIES: phytanoyl-CoA dioxygenase family protein [unclassified Kitasatospora]|uniref:phytanoyl-CoA dioxygenase family protein n=1 Tax=unclassified Kitasatospora TaxID=2633591 RepID=UPI0037FCB47E
MTMGTLDTAAIAKEIAANGYALVPDFVTGQALTDAVAAMETYFPDPEDGRTTAEEVAALKHAVPFPFSANALNRLSLDPRVIEVAEHLLGDPDLRLTSSFIQAKYGTAYGPSIDQTLHNDAWAASSLLPPRADGVYQRLFGIVYLTDVTVDTGPTYVVARAEQLGVPLLTATGKASYEKETYPELYERQRPIEAKRGSVLLFVGDIVHRGAGYQGTHGRRLALFFNIHAAVARWTDKHLWSMRPASPGWDTFREFMVELSPRQRHLLGFPPPGDGYWTEQSLERVAELYPGIDTAPYVPAELRAGR